VSLFGKRVFTPIIKDLEIVLDLGRVMIDTLLCKRQKEI
jgi:hypothetical protein